MSDVADITAVFDRYGLVTEKLPGTFPQRRFADAEEQDAAVQDVTARGLDPTGRESAGWYHADCYLSRPASDTAPITNLSPAVLRDLAAGISAGNPVELPSPEVAEL